VAILVPTVPHRLRRWLRPVVGKSWKRVYLGGMLAIGRRVRAVVGGVGVAQSKGRRKRCGECGEGDTEYVCVLHEKRRATLPLVINAQVTIGVVMHDT